VKQALLDFFLTFGVDLRKLRGALRGLPAYWRDADLQNHFGCIFGCGIFEFTRR